MKTNRKTIPKKLRIELWESVNKKCQYCGETTELENIQIDHIKPFVDGGSCKTDNYRVSCRWCNNYKYNSTPSEWKENIMVQLQRLGGQRNFQALVKFGIIEIKDKEIVFEYEKER